MLDALAESLPAEDICGAIYKMYCPEIHDRHIVAMLFSMLGGHSYRHGPAVIKFMDGWVSSDDPVKVGVAISKWIDWFPFGTVDETLEGVKSLNERFPQYGEDCEHWRVAAEKEMERIRGFKPENDPA